MSILAKCDQGWVISHPQFFSNIRVNFGESSNNLRLNPDLFHINEPFVKRKHMKRIVENEADNLIAFPELARKFKELMSEVGQSSNAIFQISDDEDNVEAKDNNSRARETAVEFLKNLDFIQDSKFQGRNDTEMDIISEVAGQICIFPEKTAFYCGQVHEVIQKMINEQTLFDLVLMDPPWKNKYIWRNNKRRKAEGGGYQLVENLQIENIPIDKISRSGALIVVWCTNAEAHQQDLILKIFPRWNVTYLTTWYWMKVTKSGEPICPFNSLNKKQPFETVIIGHYACPQRSDSCSTDSNNPLPVPSNIHPDLKTTKIIVSVPSSLHSHKPPLIEIFRKYLPHEPKCCELFARYLVPGFCSVGNEVVKLQHRSLHINR